MILQDNELARIMPNLNAAKRAQFLPFLQSALDEFEINTPLRVAAFLAQLAHESAEFRFMEEIWGPTAAQRRYEPVTQKSRDLGNTQPGDGKRFKGRGPIQLTGRANYTNYGNLLNIDLITDSTVAAKPEVGFRTAGLYWRRNGLNELADKQFFKTITKRINGGFNGLEDRTRYYVRAKAVLLGGSRGGGGGELADDNDFTAPDEIVEENDFAPDDTGEDAGTSRAERFARGNETGDNEK
jgi:predicted chitinase